MSFDPKFVHLDVDEIDPPEFSGRMLVSAFCCAIVTVSLIAAWVMLA